MIIPGVLNIVGPKRAAERENKDVLFESDELTVLDLPKIAI